MLPNFLIVGAQKAGTSALWSYLDAHPQVYLSPEKELRFFNRHYDLGLDWYRRHFEGRVGEPLVGEATPNYLYCEEVAGRIAESLPGVKLIFLFREPVSRAYSNYWHNVWLGREHLSFEEALEREDERIRLNERYPTPYWAWTYAYLDKGRYARQLRPYLENFDRSQLLFLLFEDLVKRPEATLERVYAFLGIESRPLPELGEDEKNATWVQRSVTLQRAVNRLNFFVLLQSYRLLGWRRGAWGRTNRAAMAVHWAMLKLNSVRGRYPPLDPATRARLQASFAGDNRALAELIGRRLEGWGPPAPESEVSFGTELCGDLS